MKEKSKESQNPNFKKMWFNSGLLVIFICILTKKLNLFVGLILAVFYQIFIEISKRKVKKWSLGNKR